MNYGVLGGECAASYQTPVDTQRTFDGVADAVGRVRAIRAQVDAMNNRIAPQPPTDTASGNVGSGLGRQPYAHAVSDLHNELNILVASLDALERHI